jgi:predicted short-subunit dehydrogenase-like oxidoreductase (DUF2520 family)
LAAELGPVAAQSFRLASRIVNSIGAGHPVRGYADLNDSTLILICSPASGVAAAIQALGESIECRGKTILLCDDGTDSSRLAPLRAKGASVGSIQEIPGSEGYRFVAEGDRGAVREAKNLIRKIGGRAEEVQGQKMALYSAGVSFGTSLLTPLIEASMQCFLDAGMSKPGAVKVVESLFQNSVRSYVYAGKRSWMGSLARADLSAVQREIEGLARSKPVLGEYYRQTISLAAGVMGKPKKLR